MLSGETIQAETSTIVVVAEKAATDATTIHHGDGGMVKLQRRIGAFGGGSIWCEVCRRQWPGVVCRVLVDAVGCGIIPYTVHW
mmetsp:Transcript_7679/g.17950  ORF Transcript_7679/g.17950 Transcript_7679/m.17950 type:complete len:83 (+) Transcript_7679:95-343(+)